jgi:hypothetical protein
MYFLYKNYGPNYPMWLEANMLQPNITANPEILTLLAVCVLGIGFMLRFLVALTGKENKIQVVGQVRSRSARYATDSTSDVRQRGGVVADPAAYLAMGALRITAGLASNPGHRGRAAGRSNVLMFGGPGRDSATERRYRLS